MKISEKNREWANVGGWDLAPEATYIKQNRLKMISSLLADTWRHPCQE